MLRHMTNFLPQEAVNASLALACAVREYDQATIDAITSRPDLVAVAVALAAMVEIDRSPRDLLAWNDTPVPMADAELRPHGTHAAFNRHKTRDQEPCPACVYAERTYQRERGRRRRAAC